MGRLFLINLEGNVYSCKHCRTHLATADDVISKSFHGRHGEAYLFDKVANITVGEKKEQRMLTGLHTIGEIFCVRCGSIVGWKYEAVHVVSQMYKEGKFVLEMFKVVGPEAENSNQVVGHDHTQVGSSADAGSNAASDDAADA